MKKFLPYIFILIALVGAFSFIGSASAAEECAGNRDIFTQEECNEQGYTWIPGGTVNENSGFTCRLDNKPKLHNLLNYATCIINKSVIPLIFALALASFVFGVVQFVINSSDEAKKEKGRQFMIWGIIALSVMVSVWGLVAVLGNTFGVNTGFIPQVKP
jgi:hypothetical protein